MSKKEDFNQLKEKLNATGGSLCDETYESITLKEKQKSIFLKHQPKRKKRRKKK